MRSACVVALLVLLSACATSQPQAITPCTEPRPMVCAMEFNPTCAVLADGGRKEFASPCTACADPAATGYVTGPCPE
jgi:hypothetical protein